MSKTKSMVNIALEDKETGKAQHAKNPSDASLRLHDTKSLYLTAEGGVI